MHLGRKETGHHTARKPRGWDLKSDGVASQCSKVTDCFMSMAHTGSTAGVDPIKYGNAKGCLKMGQHSEGLGRAGGRMGTRCMYV